MPSLGVPARIEVFLDYAAGLLRLEKHLHLWVLAWLEGAERDVLQVTPKGVSDRGPEGLHGVFAVRSPMRPNPIGLTAARVVRIEGAWVEVDRLDFLDGTPILDLKPYFASRDLIFSAANAQIGRPASREALRESLLLQALHFHGEFCAGLALGVRLFEHFRAEVLNMEEPRRLEVTAPLVRACLVDALMGMARVTPGRGTLRFGDGDRVRFKHDGSICTYEFTAGESAEAIFETADELLFRRVQ